MSQNLQGLNADKLLALGIEQIHACQFAIAVQVLHRALALFQQTHDYPGIVSALTNLGVAYRNLKQPKQAIMCYQKALELGQRIGAQTFFTASVLNNLGISYSANGEFQNALECFQKALLFYQQIRDRRGEANVFTNLSVTHQHLNHPQRAIEAYQRALHIAQSLQDCDLEASIRQSATSLPPQPAQPASEEPRPQASGLEDTAEANALEEEKQKLSLWVQSLETQLRQQGADDSGVLDKFNELAETCCSEGEKAGAEAVWRRMLELLQQIHGERNLASGLLLRRLAAFYRSQERYSEAESVIQRSLSMFQHLFGHNHPLIGVSFNDLAGLYFRLGRYREAETFYLQAIPILKAAGEEHPDTQNTLQNFQQLLRQAQQENRLSELSEHPLTQAGIRAINSQGN